MYWKCFKISSEAVEIKLSKLSAEENEENIDLIVKLTRGSVYEYTSRSSVSEYTL